jgi:hypothetical protein
VRFLLTIDFMYVGHPDKIPQIAKTSAEMAGSTIRLASCPKLTKRWCRINGNTTPAHDGVTTVETESTQ